MKRTRIGLILGLAFLTLLGSEAQAWQRSQVQNFATLPAGTGHPEGIAADSQGNVYVANFDIDKSSGGGDIIVFSPTGKLLHHYTLSRSSPLLLGLSFHPQNQKLLVVDFGLMPEKIIWQVDPRNGAFSEFATIPGKDAAGPNALAVDAIGNVYISDSFQGTIWRVPPTGGIATAWVAHELLRTQGVPPFGANGIAFNSAANALFVSNTGNDTVVKIPLPDGPQGTPGTPSVFVNGINGADGLMIDEKDNLWVTANQANEIVVVDPSGRVIAKLGDFDGIDEHGAPKGLIFPASTVRVGDSIYVTNLALDLRRFGLPQAVDSQWTAEVTQHTIARIPARIPAMPSRCRPEGRGSNRCLSGK